MERFLIDNVRRRVSGFVLAIPLQRVCLRAGRKRRRESGRVIAKRRAQPLTERKVDRTDGLCRANTLNDKTDRVGESARVVWGVAWG